MKCNFNEILLQLYLNQFFWFSLISLKFFWIAVFPENFWDTNSEGTWPDLLQWFRLCSNSRRKRQTPTFLMLTLKYLHDFWWLDGYTKTVLNRHPEIKYLNSFQLALHAHSWISLFFQVLHYTNSLIRQSGDIEMNLVPKPNSFHSFSTCHGNLNSLTAHNYLKVSLLRVYVAIKKVDVVCLSETYLDSSNLFDDDNFNLPGYNLVRVDHPLNTKKGVFASISKTLFL